MTNEKTIYQTLKDGYNENLWYDWFCKDSSLEAKGKSMLKKLKQIAFSKKFDINNTYVFFKNNCPMIGSLYDDFRICDLETGNVIYTITPRSGHKAQNGNGEVWGRENDFKEALFVGSWSEIKDWFNNNMLTIQEESEVLAEIKEERNRECIMEQNDVRFEE